jgi:YD repeat-containing protein
MKSFLKQLLFVAAACAAGAAHPQVILWHTLAPYDGGVRPFDPSRAVYGKTGAAVCAQRTDAEMKNFTNFPNVVFVGWIPDPNPEHPGHCGVQWLNDVSNPPVLVTTLAFQPGAAFCPDVVNGAISNPNRPVPQVCVITCPPPQVLINGECKIFSPPCCPTAGNPIHPGTGNKAQHETDLVAAVPGGLSFTRTYNTGRLSPLTAAFGGYWQHNYSRKIVAAPSGAAAAAYYKQDGRVIPFVLVAGAWVAPADVADVLVELKDANGMRTGWKYAVAANDDVETYDGSGNPVSILHRGGLSTAFVHSDGTNGASSGNGGFVLDAAGNSTGVVLEKGLLLKVRDHFGRTLLFGYDARSRIVKVTDAASGTIRYAYGPRSELLSATYQDSKQRQYLYNEQVHTGNAFFPNHLTGIVDENGDRFATFAYDTFGRAIKSTHHAGANEVDSHTVSYNGEQSTVTDPRGTARPSAFQILHGVVRQNSETQPSASGTGDASTAITYDANDNVASRTDFNGNRTNYVYDLARNLETSRTEGLTAAGNPTPLTRTITTQWHATFRLPTAIAEPLRITTNAYHATTGSLLSKTVQATTDANGSLGFSATPSGTPRTWSYTYNTNGDVLTVNGPRTDVSDVTTYTYYPSNDPDVGKRGRVATITNAAGHATSVTAYNAHGQPLTIMDPNGLTTTMTYDARLRLKTRTVGGETTTYDYDDVGNLTKTTFPDGSFLENTYDTAHRLTAIEDNLGNRVAYTLDAMGNRTAEEVRDPANQLAQTRSRVYNNLNRLFQELGAQSQTSEYGYDEQGNVVTVKDPLNRITTSQYDAFNRLKQVTSPAPISALTQYAYNGLDALTQVIDPRNLVTGYTVDGLGNLTQQSSPDSGTTASIYDSAGNLAERTDAKNQTATYAYDLLNRLTRITFHDGSEHAYAYDQGANGIGRLSSITETDPAMLVTSVIAYGYDQHGRMSSETRTINAIQYVLGYRYDSAGRLDQLTYPSGRTVSYGFDALGRVLGVTTARPGQAAQAVVASVAYHPFGSVKAYTLGNGQVYTRGIDLDGRIGSYTLGGQSFAIGYDTASRIESISANSYGYDNLDRLTSAALPAATHSYAYDAVGNRTSQVTGSSTNTYSYSATSNRIASITPSSGPARSFVFDANGSTTEDGVNTYAYDVRGRMVQATSASGATSYQVNALGQRIRKTNSLTDTVFHYDAQGRLIAETSAAGVLRRELIHLGDIPVGVIQ